MASQMHLKSPHIGKLSPPSPNAQKLSVSSPGKRVSPDIEVTGEYFLREEKPYEGSVGVYWGSNVNPSRPGAGA